MSDNELSYKVIGVAFKVHSKFGPGLLENSYKEIMNYHLIKCGLHVEQEKAIPLIVDTVKLPAGYRIDLLVEHRLVVEIKSIESIAPIHLAQVLTYLRLGNFNLGLLINFNVTDLKSGIRRVVNNFKDESA